MILCPRCNRTVSGPPEGGYFTCGAVIAVSGHHAPAGTVVPYGASYQDVCGHRFSIAEGQAAYEAHRASANAAAAGRSLHGDPRTPDRIRELAARLINERPGLAIPILAQVTIPARRRSRERTGWAEVYLAWPIGSLKRRIVGGDGPGTTETDFAVNADGRLVPTAPWGRRAGEVVAPSVTLTDHMRWENPADREWTIETPHWRSQVLRKLESDLATPVQPNALTRAPAELVERTLTFDERARCDRMETELKKLAYEYRRLTERYGTEDQPRLRGQPNRADKNGWKRMAKIRTQHASVNEALTRLDPSRAKPPLDQQS